MPKYNILNIFSNMFKTKKLLNGMLLMRRGVRKARFKKKDKGL